MKMKIYFDRLPTFPWALDKRGCRPNYGNLNWVWWSHRAWDGVVAADWRTVLCVHFTGLANLREAFVATKNRSTEPNCESLHHVLCNCTCHRVIASRDLVKDSHALVQDFLTLALETSIKALEKRWTTGQNNVFVEFYTIFDWTTLNRIIDNFSKWFTEILVNKFWMEEHLRAQEAFVANIYFDHVTV